MFTVLDDCAPNPDDLDIEITNRTHSVIVPFSECSETWRVCSIECYLTQKNEVLFEGCEPVEFFEFGFQYNITADFGQPPIHETMDRTEALEFVPEDARDLVLQIVQSACIRLLTTLRPPYLYRVAYTPSQPEKAQRKHALITFAAEAAGYEIVDEGTDRCGCRFWFMAPKLTPLTA